MTPDSGFVAGQPGHMETTVSAVLNGTIDTVTIPGCGGDLHSYVISGEMKEDMDMDFDINYTSYPDAGTMNLDCGLAFGVAYSIRDTTTNVGAKFIITFGGHMNATGVDISTGATTGNALGQSWTATLNVYDDGNNLIYSNPNVSPAVLMGIVSAWAQ